MQSHPVHFRLEGEPLPAQVEAAARRRMRLLENLYPSIRGWQVASAEIASDATAAARNALVCAITATGERLEAGASAADTLGALRLAFNELESRLAAAADQDSGPRVGHWFSRILQRTERNWAAAA